MRASRAYAVGDAKRWDRLLNAALKEGKYPFDNKNACFQICRYIPLLYVEKIGV